MIKMLNRISSRWFRSEKSEPGSARQTSHRFEMPVASAGLAARRFPRAERRRRAGFLLCFLFALASDSASKAQDLYWDANGASAGTGGTGTWTTANTWRSGSGTGALGRWLDGRNAYFGGTAGAVTIGGTAVAPATSHFTVTGYTLQTDASTTTRSHNGSIKLSENVLLKLLFPNTTAKRNLDIGGSISGDSGSALAIQGNQSDNNAARVNLSAAGATVSVPTTIAATGDGLAGFVGTASGTVIAGDIVNNSSARTMLGATSGHSLTFASGATHSGTGSLQFSAGQSGGGAGLILIEGQFVHTGTTILDHATSGVVRMGADNRLSASSGLVFNNGTLDLRGTIQTVAGLSGSGGRGIVNTSASLATLVVDLASGSHTYGAGIGQPSSMTNITGANNGIALTKQGVGTLTLTGNNSYTGATTVSAGTLLIDGDHSAATGDVTVESGATLDGSGIIGGHVIFNGGTHSPGNSPAIQTFNGGLTYGTGSSVVWELIDNTTSNSPLAFDQIVVKGQLNFAGSTTLNLVFDGSENGGVSSVDWTNPFWGPGAQSWLLYDVTGGISNFGNLSILTANWKDDGGNFFDSTTPSGSYFSLSLSGDGKQIFLNYTGVTAIPEPTTFGLLGLVMGVLALSVRGRRRLVVVG